MADTMREKLIELLERINGCCPKEDDCYHCKYEALDDCSVYAKADFLIANGVTVQGVGGCCRCKDTSEMMVAISNKLVAGVRTGWLGGNLPARYCPFCGRKLPQPPKGE